MADYQFYTTKSSTGDVLKSSKITVKVPPKITQNVIKSPKYQLFFYMKSTMMIKTAVSDFGEVEIAPILCMHNEKCSKTQDKISLSFRRLGLPN